MTGESFNTTVACKTVGTTNLFKLFGGPSLQFFIMLSSLASILGNRAQGNYAAGNAFLDHFAQMQNGDETVCYSINLGFIVDSETISAHQSRVDNVVKSGCLPLSIDQMLRVVGSAMERATRSVQRRRNVQLAIGFSGNSLARGNTKSIQRPMFGHLRHSERHGEVKSGASPKESVTEMLSKSNDRGELQVIVRGLIAQQVSSIMATKSSEMPLTTPLIELGLDSLAAVELKNWISKTLRVMLQTNEIMECNGIEQIADLVIQRSTLTSRRPGAHVGTARSNGEHESRVAETEGVTLAALPLPGLPDTLKLFKDSVAVFCCNEELQEPDRMIQNFGDPAGFGIRLQKELQKRAEDPSIKNWIYDLFTNSVYLRPRSPINPTHTFFGSHVDGSFQQSQAERAAILTTATLGFRSRLLSGELDQDFLRDRPLCMSSLHLMFNTVREPNIKLDKFQRYHDEDYLVVMRTGHYFKIHFGIENGPPLGGLIDTFQHICDLPLGPVPSVAALTATDRDSWAEVWHTPNTPVNRADQSE